jgi:hypothetical protein
MTTENHDPMCGVEGALCPTCMNAPWEPWNDDPPPQPRYTREEKKFWKAEVAAIEKPQRVPRWLEWTRENDKRGKDLTGRGA